MPCRKSDRFRKVIAAARIPRRYEKCSFATSRAPGTSQDNALLHAHKFANEYPAVERGLLFMWPGGRRQTHLAVSIIRDLIDKGFASVYEFGSLLKEIQDSYNPISKSSELKVLAPVFQTDVLVLDELGATVPTDWVRDTMYQIINKRYNDNKLTIFTTNYLIKTRSLKNESRTGCAAVFLKCVNVVIDGEDFRRRKPDFLMPKRTDIRKILIIGSGPIVIGQACEFDYSGNGAQSAATEGYEIVLVN